MTKRQDKHALFAGTAMKIKIVSNSLSGEPCLLPSDEEEQRLTLTADGRVYFSAYALGGENKLCRIRSKRCKLEADKAAAIVKTIADYFSSEHNERSVTGVSRWELTLTNEEGISWRFQGSLWEGVAGVLRACSDSIRCSLSLPELFVFDGRTNPDRVERICVDYRCVRAGEPDRPVTEAAYEYDEHLTIDRSTQTLELIRNTVGGCRSSQQIHAESVASDLLDYLDAEYLFTYTAGSPPDIISDPLETATYKITVTYLFSEQKVLTGSFDSYGLPADYPDFAEEVLGFLERNHGAVLNPWIYDKTPRRQSDCIVCHVRFESPGKTYCYLTQDETLEVGDSVVVPVGDRNHKLHAQIESIEYYPPERVPYPMDKIKWIIGKADKNDQAHDEPDDLSN